MLVAREVVFSVFGRADIREIAFRRLFDELTERELIIVGLGTFMALIRSRYDSTGDDAILLVVLWPNACSRDLNSAWSCARVSSITLRFSPPAFILSSSARVRLTLLRSLFASDVMGVADRAEEVAVRALFWLGRADRPEMVLRRLFEELTVRELIARFTVLDRADRLEIVFLRFCDDLVGRALFFTLFGRADRPKIAFRRLLEEFTDREFIADMFTAFARTADLLEETEEREVAAG